MNFKRHVPLAALLAIITLEPSTSVQTVSADAPTALMFEKSENFTR